MKPLRVVMVTGSYPPEPCGVGGYTARLVKELKSQGVDVHVYREGPWGIGNTSRIVNHIHKLNPDVTHIQYPTVGFNRSLGPQALSLKLKNTVATIHEVSQVHSLRRLSLYPFSFGCRALLFSNQYDRDYATRFAPWINQKSHIVPLSSSIPLFAEKSERDIDDVICFGLIRPQKGIEEFIEAAAESKRRNLPFRFTIVGMMDPRFLDYATSLRKIAADLPLAWELGLDDAAVAERISKAAFAYMAYPDGATERRTSLIALLAQGLAVLTTASNMTPTVFKSELILVENPKLAVEKLTELAGNRNALNATIRNGIELAKRFDWPQIASRHIAIYRSLLS
jgi:glycosyltransferase involved in cell wall biosynthesis